MIRKISHSIVCILLIGSCQNTPPKPTLTDLNKSQDLNFKIVDAPHNTFGFEIYADGKKVIHQPNTSTLPIIDGFKSYQRAVKAAALLIKKMKKGERFPVITQKELKILDIL
jgi:Domain of unknown function (DUF4907)